MVLFFGRSILTSILPRKWGTNIDKTDFFRVWVIWAPKHENVFFTKVRSQRAHFFVYRRPQGIYADFTSKLQREQTTGFGRGRSHRKPSKISTAGAFTIITTPAPLRAPDNGTCKGNAKSWHAAGATTRGAAAMLLRCRRRPTCCPLRCSR